MSLDEVLWRGAALVFSHLNFYPLILHVFSRKIFFHYYITWKKEVSLQTVELWFQTCPLRSRVLHNRFNKNYLHLYYVLLFKVISTAVVWLFWIGPSEGERGGKFKRRWWLISRWYWIERSKYLITYNIQNLKKTQHLKSSLTYYNSAW